MIKSTLKNNTSLKGAKIRLRGSKNTSRSLIILAPQGIQDFTKRTKVIKYLKT